jgi:hypothetical protein
VLALAHTTVLPSVLADAVGTLHSRFRSSIPSLHIPLSNASSAASRLPSHGSGPGWFATPFLYDSFIHYSTPVYPDAIQPRLAAPRLYAIPASRKNFAASSGGVGLIWNPVAHSKPATRVSLGMISMCQW